METSCTIFRSSSVSKSINVWNSSRGVIPRNGPCIISLQASYIRCSAKSNNSPSAPIMKTCRNCKKQFDPLENHHRSCRYHTAHFGGKPHDFNTVSSIYLSICSCGAQSTSCWHMRPKAFHFTYILLLNFRISMIFYLWRKFIVNLNLTFCMLRLRVWMPTR